MRNLKPKTPMFVQGKRSPEVNVLTFHEMAPIMIDDAPGVLDDLGLTEARENMDRAHNKMIQKKYDLKLFTESPGAYTNESGPFDLYGAAISPRTPAVDMSRIQNYIDTISLRDDEYREAAKQYLADVLPAVLAQQQALYDEIRDRELELAQVTHDYEARVREAKARLNRFNKGIGREVKKFITADEGSHTAENHCVTSPGRKGLLEWAFIPKEEQYKGLLFIKRRIKEIEDYRNQTPEEKTEEALRYRRSEARRTIS